MNGTHEIDALLLKCEQHETTRELAFMSLTMHKNRCFAIIAARLVAPERERRIEQSRYQLALDLVDILKPWTVDMEDDSPATVAGENNQHTKTVKE